MRLYARQLLIAPRRRNARAERLSLLKEGLKTARGAKPLAVLEMSQGLGNLRFVTNFLRIAVCASATIQSRSSDQGPS